MKTIITEIINEPRYVNLDMNDFSSFGETIDRIKNVDLSPSIEKLCHKAYDDTCAECAAVYWGATKPDTQWGVRLQAVLEPEKKYTGVFHAPVVYNPDARTKYVQEFISGCGNDIFVLFHMMEMLDSEGESVYGEIPID